MSEKLTAEDIFNGYAQSDAYDNSCLYPDNALRAMEEYAAQQVEEHKYTNQILAVGYNRLNKENEQIKEERDRALDLLKQANSILNIRNDRIESWGPFAQDVQDFFNSINNPNG